MDRCSRRAVLCGSPGVNPVARERCLIQIKTVFQNAETPLHGGIVNGAPGQFALEGLGDQGGEGDAAIHCLVFGFANQFGVECDGDVHGNTVLQDHGAARRVQGGTLRIGSGI